MNFTKRRNAATMIPMSSLVTLVQLVAIVDTDCARPTIPSPIMINVRVPLRSTRFVCLKLKTGETLEVAITAIASTKTTTYLSNMSKDE